MIRSTRRCLACLALVSTAALAWCVPAGAVTFTPFPLTGAMGATSIASAPDGSMWVTDPGGNQILRVASDGAVSTVVHPGSGLTKPHWITAGPDGNMWVTEDHGIARITPSGEVREFSFLIPPIEIAAGGDGNLWFVNFDGAGRITPTGEITMLPPDPDVAHPTSIAAAVDGSLWFTEPAEARIVHVALDGTISRFSIGPPRVSGPVQIAAGADGAMWFTDPLSAVSRIAPDGATSTVPLGTDARAIAAGPDGATWIASSSALDRVAVDGTTTIYRYPPPDPRTVARFGGIVAGPHGTLWLLGSVGGIGVSVIRVSNLGDPGVRIAPTPAARDMSIAPSRFRAADRGPSVSTRVGDGSALVTFSLRQVAIVKFTVVRLALGRRARSGRCVVPSRATRRARRCTRIVHLPQTFSELLPAGTAWLRFTGRLWSHALPPGTYRLYANPLSADRTIDSSTVASAPFHIVGG